MKNGTWLLLSLLCVLIVGLVVERFAVYCRDERKKERKKQKTHHCLSMASFSLWILSSRSLEPGIYFQGVKKRNVSI